MGFQVHLDTTLSWGELNGTTARGFCVMWLQEAKIPLSPLHVDKLIESLDQDGDGEIDFR